MKICIQECLCQGQCYEGCPCMDWCRDYQPPTTTTTTTTSTTTTTTTTSTTFHLADIDQIFDQNNKAISKETMMNGILMITEKTPLIFDYTYSSKIHYSRLQYYLVLLYLRIKENTKCSTRIELRSIEI